MNVSDIRFSTDTDIASFTNEHATSVEIVTEIEWLTSFETEDVTTTLTPSEVDVLPYIHRLVVGIIILLFTPIGILLNGLVIMSVIISKKLQTPTNILVASLAAADFLVCAAAPIFVVPAIIKGSEWSLLPVSICKISMGVMVISLAVSIMSLTAIAFIRWYVITRSIRGHQGLHTPRRVAMLAVFIWTTSTLVTGTGLALDVVEVGYHRYYLFCLGTDPGIIIIVLNGGFVVINLTLTATFYALVLRFVLRHNRQFRNKYGVHSIKSGKDPHAKPPNCGNRNEVVNRREVEITKNLFLVVCIFVLCWMSAVLVNRVFPEKKAFIIVYFILMSVANSILNPIIYGFRHPNFREVFKRILCCSSEPPKFINV